MPRPYSQCGQRMRKSRAKENSLRPTWTDGSPREKVQSRKCVWRVTGRYQTPKKRENNNHKKNNNRARRLPRLLLQSAEIQLSQGPLQFTVFALRRELQSCWPKPGSGRGLWCFPQRGCGVSQFSLTRRYPT